MLFGDIEDDLAGPDSSAVASYNTPVTTPSATSAPYFYSADSAPTSSVGGSTWYTDLGKALTTGFGTGIGTAITNFLKPKSATPPAAKPQSSPNMLVTVGIVGAAVVGAVLLLRRRRA